MLTILHTNDGHGHLLPWQGWEGELAGRTVGGYDRLATLVRNVREEVGAQNALLLEAGDVLGDDFLASETQGSIVIAVMNAIGYDAMTVGNHEPDFGSGALLDRASGAAFPLLACNILDADGSLLLKPFAVFQPAGLRVGVLGIAYPGTPLTTSEANVRGLQFLEPIGAARKHLATMHSLGLDVTVALTHLGLSADIGLARSVAGIDLIVGGHSHNRMSSPLRVGETLIVQAGAHCSDLGRIDLEVEGGRVVVRGRNLLPVTDVDPDPEVAGIIARSLEPFESDLAEPIAELLAPLPRAQTLAGQEPRKRDAESPADSLFADAVRETTGADIALLPGVGYGVALEAGTVTAGQLRNLLPHNSPIWTMDLTGAQVLQVLEQAIENVFTSDTSRKVGGMIQISGLHFGYDQSAPQGRRVTAADATDGALDPARTYRVAVNGLLAQGGHRYTLLRHGTNRVQVGDQYEIVRRWLAARRRVAPPTMGRIGRAEVKDMAA